MRSLHYSITLQSHVQYSQQLGHFVPFPMQNHHRCTPWSVNLCGYLYFRLWENPRFFNKRGHLKKIPGDIPMITLVWINNDEHLLFQKWCLPPSDWPFELSRLQLPFRVCKFCRWMAICKRSVEFVEWLQPECEEHADNNRNWLERRKFYSKQDSVDLLFFVHTHNFLREGLQIWKLYPSFCIAVVKRWSNSLARKWHFPTRISRRIPTVLSK